MDNRLNVQSIFTSLDGEANGFEGAGQLSTFIRLKGCNLRCKYCDTKYAQESLPENLMTVEEIINQIPEGCKKITLTGGSPFFQLEKVGLLLIALRQWSNYQIAITIETNGSIDPAELAANYFKSMGEEGRETVRKQLVIPYLNGDSLLQICYLDSDIRLVVDYKLPSSGMEASMNFNLFKKLRDVDVIKFVISDEADYQRACEILGEHPEWQAKKVFSPATRIICIREENNVYSEEEYYCDNTWPRKLAEMMIQDGLWNVQFSLQIHKCLWPGTKVER